MAGDRYLVFQCFFFRVRKLRFVGIFFGSLKHFTSILSLFSCMGTTRKIAIGLSIASGAIFATWLMTGDRAPRTKNYIVRRARNFKVAIKDNKYYDDNEIHYI